MNLGLSKIVLTIR